MTAEIIEVSTRSGGGINFAFTVAKRKLQELKH